MRLEDYLKNPNLLIKKTDLENEIEKYAELDMERILRSAEFGGREFNEFVMDHELQNPEKVIVESVQSEIPNYLLNDPQVVGYPDLEMQEQIYDWVLWDVKNEVSIKDYGCGRGDFYERIIKSGYSIDYTGIDNKISLINAGQQKCPGINLIHGDYLQQDIRTDYTICIGTLNDDHGFDKWDYFNKTLNKALDTTDIAIIFILSRNFDGLEGFLDYSFEELFCNLSKDLRFEIDYSKFEDIYKLTVHIGGFN